MTDGADDQVRDLLGRAFGEEPPLRIDRDEVIGQGRKRLRRKRFLEAGSVVAAVVVAAVGAATLTNLAGSEPDRLPPAASSTVSAPPGPPLPVTTDTTPPPSSARTTNTQVPAAINGDRLTAMLYSTGIVSAKEVRPLPGRSGIPEFRPTGPGGFVYEADLYRGNAKGFVQVIVGTSMDIGTGCSSAPRPKAECEVRNKTGTDVVVTRFDDDDGQRHTTATTVLPNGVKIYAMATNTSLRDSDAGVLGDGSPPVLTDDELCVLVAKVGSSA